MTPTRSPARARSGTRCRQGALVALLISLAIPASAQIAPTPHALPPLPGDDGGVAFAINNRGDVAGVSWGVGPGGTQTAVKWNRKGEPTALPPLAGDAESVAFAINLRGETAGDSGDDVGNLYNGTAVRWDVDGLPQALLPLPGDTISHAQGINNAGQVVGTSFGSSGSTAVIWELDGTPRALAGGIEGVAINNRGKVAGIGVEGPTLWGRTGIARPLKSIGDGACDSAPQVAGMTWRGEVVGSAKFEKDYCAPVRWDQAGEPEFLELRETDDPSLYGLYWESEAYGIEPTGEVVGWTSNGYGSLWDRSGSLIFLPAPEGYEEAYAHAINNRGEIAGGYRGPGVVSGDFTVKPAVWR